MKKLFGAMVVGAGLFISMSSVSGQVNSAFEKVNCPTGINATTCGFVSVPENRAKPEKKIKLFVTISKAKTEKQEPLFFLSGGPGEHGAQYAVLAQLFTTRDFIAFDQRGVGRSLPALNCDTTAAGSETLAASADATLKILTICGENWKTQGIDLTAYHATESAADVNDIRLALGYEKISLFGVSYGTRLAQEVMRTFGSTLKSVLIDSVIPPQIDRSADTIYSIDESLKKVFATCKADGFCSGKYPNLETEYQNLYLALNAKPLEVTLAKETFFMDGDTMQNLIFTSLYSPDGIAELPQLLFNLKAGQGNALQGKFVEQFFNSVSAGISFGAFFTHECRGEFAFSSLAQLRLTYAALPQWANTFKTNVGMSSERGFSLCQNLGLTTPSGLENMAVTSNVRTLLMAGEFDPVTPVRYLPIASAGLKNSVSVAIKGGAHAVSLATQCGLSIMLKFFANLEIALDVMCANQGKIRFL